MNMFDFAGTGHQMDCKILLLLLSNFLRPLVPPSVVSMFSWLQGANRRNASLDWMV
jgi:hypothetical protein